MSDGWLPQEAIRRKRDGGRLEAADLARIASGLADGSLSDAQAGAFAMAVWLRGMDFAECADWTRAVRDSGEVFDWRRESPPGPILDKHSTGGVGDLVSLALGPMLAACGAWVPMVVGRGLAHTGGTLDKLESIPGYASRPEPGRVRRAVREAGVAIVGAGDRIAPADRRLYAIRDVTATVDCLPLIVASILSKKLAAGLDALVLDVKRGNGAVLPEPGRGRELARAMQATAAEAGLSMTALMTDMSEPLARSAGNALEVHEAIAMLQGADGDPRLREVTLALGAEVMVQGGLAPDGAAARKALDASLASGRAAERFSRMVASLGGPSDLLERAGSYLPRAPVVADVAAPATGTVLAIDTRAVGLAVVRLGGGRVAPGQAIDHAVGFDRLVPRGAKLRAGDPIARVHARTPEAAKAAAAELAAEFTIGDGRPEAPPLVERLG
ncbi:MAG TPA: thymidine phosphorylase [Steroidobacteraceae bacterium]|nr:thymidine phosphorylase [Steroidobacteraceae bacterium]